MLNTRTRLGYVLNTKKTRVMLGIKVWPEAKAALEDAAKEASLSLSELCRRLLGIGLKHWKRGER